MKIIHTADWHFRDKDHDEILKCVSFIVDRAIKEEPDLICISGDMTDSRNLNLDSRSARSIFKVIQRLLNIAPVAVVIGTPFHDGKAALALRSCKGKYPIVVSDMPGQFGYISSHGGEWLTLQEIVEDGFMPELILTQIPQPTKQYFVNELSIEDTEKAIGEAMGLMLATFGHTAKTQFDNVPHIANGHGQIGGAFISDTQQLIGYDIEISKAQLINLNADLVCYGHIHKAQAFGHGIFYSGSPTRMTHGEQEDKGFYIHKIDFPNSTWKGSEFIQTPARQMIGIKIDYTDDSEKMTLQNYLTKYIYINCNVKFELKGWQDDLVDISQDKIKKQFYNAGADHVIVNIVRVPRETVRAEKVLVAETLPEKLEAMAALRGEEVSGSILDKAASLEADEQQPWVQKKKEIK